MIRLKRKPTIKMPEATIATNAAMSCHFRTFFKIIISGSESAITDIIKASAVPSETPLSISTLTIGIIPAAFEYIGTPSKMASGTPYQFPSPSRELMKSSGT